MSSGLPSKVGKSVHTGLRVRGRVLRGNCKGSSSSTALHMGHSVAEAIA